MLQHCLLYLLTSTWLCSVRGNTDPCTTVATLSQSWRNLNPPPGADPGKENCDKLTEGWYHFQLDGEDAQLPTSCLQDNVCGTLISLRVELKAGEDLTALAEGNETEASICGSYNVLRTLDCCVQRQPVRIRRCSKTKLVYRLPATHLCPMAFCAHKVSELVPTDVLARHGDRPRSLGPEPNTTADPDPSTASGDDSTHETLTATTDHSPPINRPLVQLPDSNSSSIAASPPSSQTSHSPSPPASPTTLPDVATSPRPESSAGATDSGPVPHPQASSTSPLPGSSPPPPSAPSSSSSPLSTSSLPAASSPSLSSSVYVLSSQSVSSLSSSVLSSVPSSTSPPSSSSASGLQASVTAGNSDASSSTPEMPANVTDLSTLAGSAAGKASDEVSSDQGPTTAAAPSSAATTPASPSADDYAASVGATVPQGDPGAITVATSDDTSPPDEAASTATTTNAASSTRVVTSVMAAMTQTTSGWTTPRASPDKGPKSDQAVCFVVRGDYKASTLEWLKTKVRAAPLTSRPDVNISDFHLTVQEPITKHQLTCVEMNITNPLTNATFAASHVVAVLKNSSMAEDFESAHASLSLEMHEASCQNQCYEAKADSLSLYETNKPLFVALISIALLAMVALVLLLLFLRWRKQGTWAVSEDQDHEDCEKCADHNSLAVESPMTDSQIQQGEEKMAAAGEATLSNNGHRPPTPAYDIPLADDDDGWVVPLDEAPPPPTLTPAADPSPADPHSLQDLALKTEDTKL